MNYNLMIINKLLRNRRQTCLISNTRWDNVNFANKPWTADISETFDTPDQKSLNKCYTQGKVENTRTSVSEISDSNRNEQVVTI